MFRPRKTTIKASQEGEVQCVSLIKGNARFHSSKASNSFSSPLPRLMLLERVQRCASSRKFACPSASYKIIIVKTTQNTPSFANKYIARVSLGCLLTFSLQRNHYGTLSLWVR